MNCTQWEKLKEDLDNDIFGVSICLSSKYTRGCSKDVALDRSRDHHISIQNHFIKLFLQSLHRITFPTLDDKGNRLVSGNYRVQMFYEDTEVSMFDQNEIEFTPGLSFVDGNCWHSNLTLTAEGGMWLNCTGKELPKRGSEKFFEVEFRKSSTKIQQDPMQQKFWVTNTCRSEDLLFSNDGSWIRTGFCHNFCLLMRTVFWLKTLDILVQLQNSFLQVADSPMYEQWLCSRQWRYISSTSTKCLWNWCLSRLMVP